MASLSTQPQSSPEKKPVVTIETNESQEGNLPSFVTLRLMGNVDITTQVIQLDSEWKREIVEKTWGENLFAPRNVSLSAVGSKYLTFMEQYAILAHASGEIMAQPCTECAKYPYLGDCRVNAVWPPSISCTSCAFQGKTGECSLREGRNPRVKGPESDERQIVLRTSDQGLAPWERYLHDSLRRAKGKGELVKFQERLKMVGEAVEKLIEFESLFDLGGDVKKNGSQGICD